MTRTFAKPGTSAISPEDLLILERRGTLTASERRRLQMCLDASASLRALRQMGRVFDEMPRVTPLDAALADHLTKTITQLRCVDATGQRGRARARKITRPLAAALLLASLAAAAAVLPWHRITPRFALPRPAGHDRQVPPVGAVVPSDSIAPQPSGRYREHLQDPEIQSASAVPSASSHSAVAPVTALSGSRVHEPPPSRTSAQLFSAANSLRRQGQLPRASALYRQLQYQFPQSDEARLSYVVLARLELARGAPRQALAEFETYLTQVPGGSLEQEALQGKAQALSRMGRTQEQRAVLNQLLTRYPNSVYAAGAREQLAPKR